MIRPNIQASWALWLQNPETQPRVEILGREIFRLWVLSYTPTKLDFWEMGIRNKKATTSQTSRAHAAEQRKQSTW